MHPLHVSFSLPSLINSTSPILLSQEVQRFEALNKLQCTLECWSSLWPYLYFLGKLLVWRSPWRASFRRPSKLRRVSKWHWLLQHILTCFPQSRSPSEGLSPTLEIKIFFLMKWICGRIHGVIPQKSRLLPLGRRKSNLYPNNAKSLILEAPTEPHPHYSSTVTNIVLRKPIVTSDFIHQLLKIQIW